MPEQKQEITVDEALEIGLGHYDAGRLPEAESIYTQIITKFPKMLLR